MTSPTRFLNRRKFRDQFPRRAAFHSPRQVARRNVRRNRYVQMRVILTHMTFQDIRFHFRKNLPNSIPRPRGDRTGQQRFAEFRDPHKVQFNIKFSMRRATIIIHVAYCNIFIA